MNCLKKLMILKHVYFDNFFTSLSFLEQLKKKSIPATGTVRINRLPGLLSPTNKQVEKREGFYDCM